MSQNKVNAKLAQVIAREFHLDPREISVEDSVDTIEEWDSLGHIQLILSIEEAFKIRFSTELIRKLINVRIIQDTLRKRKNKRNEEKQKN